MATKATALVDIEDHLFKNQLLSAIKVYNESYHKITISEFLNCCRNVGEFSNYEELTESIEEIILNCNLVLKDIQNLKDEEATS